MGRVWIRYTHTLPENLLMDTRISIPISIHTRILPGFIIQGYPYPTRNPFNFFFNPKHFNLKTNQLLYLKKEKTNQ